MHRQVGDLKIDENGIARRGLIIRHLILPGNIAKTDKVIDFVHALSPDTYFNLMDQYHPSFKAFSDPRINRRLTIAEYEEARNYAIRIGLNRLAS
jgi:putative pyruvate formate lyase activating enzyme